MFNALIATKPTGISKNSPLLCTYAALLLLPLRSLGQQSLRWTLLHKVLVNLQALQTLKSMSPNWP